MNTYMSTLTNYNVDGRAGRKEYWIFQLINSIILSVFVSVFLVSIIPSIGYQEAPSAFAFITLGLAFVFSLIILVPSITVTVRRLHDIGMSGWLYLVSLIPGIGGIIVLILVCLPSQPSQNIYDRDI